MVSHRSGFSTVSLSLIIVSHVFCSIGFNVDQVAVRQLEIYTTAVLLATLHPPTAPRINIWRGIMDEISDVSCKSYRSVVYENKQFISVSFA